MTDKIDLSIIIPAYNVEKEIDRCLQSILFQNSPLSYECIVVEDGSDDGTLAIIEELGKIFPQIRLFVRKNTGSAGATRNYGLQFARGNYIWFVDADDYVTDDALTTLWSLMESGREAPPDIYLFSHRVYFADDNRMEPIFAWDGECLFHTSVEKGITTTIWEHPEFLTAAPHMWHYLFRRQFIIDSEIRFSEDVLIAEDHVFVCGLLCHAKSIVPVDRELYVYCIDESRRTSVAPRTRHVNDIRRHAIIKQFQRTEEIISRTVGEPGLRSFRLFKLSTLQWTIDRIAPEHRPVLLDYAEKTIAGMDERSLREAYEKLWNTKHLRVMFLKEILNKVCFQNVAASIAVHVPLNGPSPEKCLDSLKKQTLDSRYYEVILVCPRLGKMRDICEKYLDETTNFSLRSVNDVTPLKTREVAMNDAVGEYICFIDSTIVYRPDALFEIIGEAVMKNVDFIFSNYDYILRYDGGKAIKRHNRTWESVYSQELRSLPNDRMRLLLCDLILPLFCSFYRRRFLDRVISETELPAIKSPLLIQFLSVMAAEVFTFQAVRYLVSCIDSEASLIKAFDDEVTDVTEHGMRLRKWLETDGDARLYRKALTRKCLGMTATQFQSPETRRVFLSKVNVLCPPLSLTEVIAYRNTFLGVPLNKAVHDYFASRGLPRLAKIGDCFVCVARRVRNFFCGC